MKHILFYLDRISKLLSEAAAVLAGLFILATAFIIVYEIIMRGIFHAPTEWVLEVSTYFIIMAGFLGLAITFRHDAHVRVDFLTGKLTPAHQRLVNLVTNFPVHSPFPDFHDRKHGSGHFFLYLWQAVAFYSSLPTVYSSIGTSPGIGLAAD
jgi:TRAP-type mannitol/chloroaromatic compound transport system permease small subunit